MRMTKRGIVNPITDCTGFWVDSPAGTIWVG